MHFPQTRLLLAVKALLFRPFVECLLLQDAAVIKRQYRHHSRYFANRPIAARPTIWSSTTCCIFCWKTRPRERTNRARWCCMADNPPGAQTAIRLPEKYRHAFSGSPNPTQ
ncbi:hypothetical protein [Eikenella sp. Marseille-P7795]|uniref:hypothetical protein n=1 Tax=Eikenella sp. Marseille-P7795 TaxID=2866577 RepID=UPI001CE3D97B|nr:hypothetical protein [Eikenella sp. Marseille-P7795]